MKVLAFLTVSVTLLSCSTPSTVAPLSVPLEYKMMADPGEFTPLPSCAAISGVRVSDKRTDSAIGRRFIEGKSGAAAPVTATGDLAAWVQSGVENALKRSGVAVGTAGAPVLHVTVDQITTNENVLHRSGYDGRIVLSGELRSGNSACWQGHAEGYAENYGYTGSIENYQETLNHALDRGVIRLLNSSDFRSAVCSKCG